MTTRISDFARGTSPLLQRAVFAAICLSAAPSPVCAQRATAAPVPGAPVAQVSVAPVSEQRADETRNQLNQLLQDHPPAVREVLQREPALLGNADYLAPYPRLGAFVAAHPEISRSPSYYLGEPHRYEPERRYVDVAGVDELDFRRHPPAGARLSVSAGLYAPRLDHRRWQRVSKVQVDTHSKLLDRMTSSDDLRSTWRRRPVDSSWSRRESPSTAFSLHSRRQSVVSCGRCRSVSSRSSWASRSSS